MKKFFIVLSSLIILAFLVGASCNSQPKGTEVFGKTGKGDKITVDQMAKIAPGLGVLMMEIGNRYWALYYAGIDGNWDLAAYEIEEIEEAMEVANVTRPKRKEALESFINTSLKPIEKAVKAKNVGDFKAKFDEGTKACNSCHAITGHGFADWKLPAERPPDLETKSL